MDINYHYFAVKAIASKAGFSKDEAQQIASYSQFVDDFDLYAWISMDYVPPYAQYLATKFSKWWFFNPVTTGFNDWFDMAMLMLAKNQKWIVTPFHFIPEKPVKEIPDRVNRRVVPARMDTPSLISNMLKSARETLIKDRAINREINLMRIGALLHIFADTYAHQNFSGYQGWENHSYITNVTDNINDRDITKSYEPGKYYLLPSIGHANVNHAPDDSNVTFNMRQKLKDTDSSYSVNYSRSNTRDYTLISKEIFNFLSACLEKTPVSDDEWEALKKLLVQGFLTGSKDSDVLAKHWNRIFPDIEFKYDKSGMIESLLTVDESSPVKMSVTEALQSQSDEVIFKAKSDMFFRYNVVADVIRVTVNKEKYSDPEWEAFTNELLSKEETYQNELLTKNRQ